MWKRILHSLIEPASLCYLNYEPVFSLREQAPLFLFSIIVIASRMSIPALFTINATKLHVLMIKKPQGRMDSLSSKHQHHHQHG